MGARGKPAALFASRGRPLGADRFVVLDADGQTVASGTQIEGVDDASGLQILEGDKLGAAKVPQCGLECLLRSF